MSKCKYCGELLANNDAAVQHAGECEIMNGDMHTAQKYKHITDAQNIDGMSAWQFEGNLTGHRCPNCGACLWVNQIGNIWCSNC